MKNNIYKVDIYTYLFALFEINNFIEENDITFTNLKINKMVIQNKFDELFSLNDFNLDKEKIQKLLNCVGNALFIKKQQLYFSKFSDILLVFVACSVIETDKTKLFDYIKNNLLANSHSEHLPIFKDMCEKKYPLYKKEVNKIMYYMKRKINSKHKSGGK